MQEGRTGETASEGDARIWAERIADWFYIDLSLLGIVNAAVKTEPQWTYLWRPEEAQNSFADTTVESIVLEASHEHPQLRRCPRRRLVRHETRPQTQAAGDKSTALASP